MPSYRGHNVSRSPTGRRQHPYVDGVGLDTASPLGASTLYPCSTDASVQSMSYHVTHDVTRHCPLMYRYDISTITSAPFFGDRLCQQASTTNGRMYDHVASLAMRYGSPKHTDIVSKLWQLHWQSNDWLSCPINLQPRKDRANFTCFPDVYDLRYAPANTLVVDFANKRVGGGCFRSGFVQEEQMVMQSLDLAARLFAHRPLLEWNEAVTFEGVHFDAWWPRAAAAQKADISLSDVQPRTSKPTTVIAVNAPVVWMRYNPASLQMLACKIALIYAAAHRLHSPLIYTGLLGGGAYRNNRPLVLLLHLLLQPDHNQYAVEFHHPIFWAFGHLPTARLEQCLLDKADILLYALAQANVDTLGDALDTIASWDLPTSHSDLDLL